MTFAAVGHPCKRVMVIDDDDDLRETICELLADEGIELLAARSGREAPQLLAQEAPPDAILLDLGMPAMTGEEFLARLRQNDDWQTIPVAVMSGYASSRYAYVPDADAVVPKPFSLVGVNDALAKLCREGRRKRAIA